MLDITGDDIKELNDVDLRSLIGLLCEADLRSSHLPIAGVTWGGHQNAADGGIDVRVNLTTVLGEDGFIPRSKTGFQVKKPDMNRSAIFSEMKPNNALRDVIKELADEGGAYIIVSSQGSTADSALTSRKNAMVDALADYLNASNLKVDFYDRDRIAGWVRCHPSLILWVRDKIGRPIQGWRSYSNWTGNIEEDVYILDENLRLYNSANTNIEGLSSLDGIKGLQVKLKQPGSSVRLVGLSGVGKTRFVQALFEDSLSENALNKNQVFYTDINYSPNPDPISFAERIIALNQPGILVIDNCPPDLHNRLTTLCSSPRSLISLLTVEYDVKDDMPEETEVYRLKPSSNELIEKLVETKFPHISQVDCRTIANFSGGNARIAIALAKTIRRGESLGNLRDSELFVRLFQQRNHVDQKLQRAAEVCSLVYSFDIQTAEGFNYELKQLGSLIGLSVQDLYQCVRELQRRNLVQMRSNWRAVLPHAIAIRLARNALENIPLESILNVFEKDETGRLLKSFSKRLSFLHGSTEAKEIAKKWLSDDGLLGNLVNLNELGISLLRNIAPISPELVLNALERVYDRDIGATYFTRDNSYYNDISRLLRSLAYDENLFIQSVNLLSQIALSEKVNENNNSIRSMLKSMFTLYLSGTHASAEQRLSFIKKLIYSNKSNQTELGILLLSSALETWHFSSHYGFEFGS
ncbi:MAG: hypothetical protein R3250_09555, partial [Melioribacteraceae bacterium]|nr:hypothetical protein [Melioribacteraceae bacterium]